MSGKILNNFSSWYNCQICLPLIIYRTWREDLWLVQPTYNSWSIVSTGAELWNNVSHNSISHLYDSMHTTMQAYINSVEKEWDLSAVNVSLFFESVNVLWLYIICLILSKLLIFSELQFYFPSESVCVCMYVCMHNYVYVYWLILWLCE